MTSLDERAISVIRGLAMDAPHAARSGHQGTAMALAPLGHVLFSRVMTYDADDPSWFDRDRFILSAGHASILQYALLHLAGFGLTLDDLRDFRQWGSATPGHPEAGHTAGVEVTTGPLGQGFADGVGMAIAEASVRARLGADVCDHHIWVVCGDGDLSEGVSHEAASLAGHLGLGRLVAVYDDNRITIDGATDLALSDDPVGRFTAYGWHVVDLGEAAEDLDALEAALTEAAQVDDRPSLLVLRSHIAYPSPDKTDDHEAHGYALFDDEIAATKEVMGIPVDETFWVPDDVAAWYHDLGRRGGEARRAWQAGVAARPDREVVDAVLAGRGRPGWDEGLPSWEPGDSVATRKASGAALGALADGVPGLLGGGADLTGNTGTTLRGHGVFSAADRTGRQVYFGVREHAMGAALVGAALHGGVVPVGGTFLVFSDYMRPALRLAALSSAPAVFVFTHDSVGVGEDGPTHQPVEHVMSLRAVPGLRVLRPADANETVACWRLAVEHDGPSALVLSRQDLPVLEGTDADGVARGAYVLGEGGGDVVLVGTGSEVAVCVEAAAALAADGIAARVVSMPCWELFAEQDEAGQAEVFPPGQPVVSVEAGVTLGWERYADATVGIDRFGASAPGGEVLRRLGITAEHVADVARGLVEGQASPGQTR